MEITDEQRDTLKTLTCERVSCDNENMRLIDDFENYKNDSIADSFRNEAYRQDEENRVAYYVIKDKEKRILFFFSLKCGALFDNFLEADRLNRIKDIYEHFKDYAEANPESEEAQYFNTFVEEIRSKKIIKKEIVANILHRCGQDEDLNEIFDESIKSVGKTYAGVELVHFCANDKYREVWNDMGLPQSIGVVVFWNFIIPIVEDLMKLVGCEYIFLFAADLSPDFELVAYYKDRLKFCDNAEHTVAKPLYDFACKFLYQETTNINDKREYFFKHFNPEENAI